VIPDRALFYPQDTKTLTVIVNRSLEN
jgi:hypothetical protein